MSQWKEYKLGELGFFFGGVTSVKREDYGFGTPFLPYKNVYKNSRVNINELELMNVSQNDIEKRSCMYGDIFFTASSETPDEVAMSSVLLDHVPKLTFNGFCKRFRLFDFNTLNPEYARYLFRGSKFREDVYELANGDIRYNISQESLASISVTLPPLPTQTAIASILSSLDEKIELNNAINKNLEALAQALFKQWFVEFNFPVDEHGNFSPLSGEMSEGQRGYKDSGGEMIESELGMIPKGWRVGKLDDILVVKGGTTPSTKESKYWDGNFRWTSPRDLSTLEFPVLLNTDKRITEEGLRQISSGLLPKGTLLLSSRAPIGYLAITEIETAINQGYIAINCKQPYSNLFMLYWLRQYMESVIARANGSTFLEISKSNFKDIDLIIPSEAIHNHFIEVVSPLFNQLVLFQRENNRLSTLRDTLLPKLISGELEVNEALTQTEKAV